jgi:biotin transporter BioY
MLNEAQKIARAKRKVEALTGFYIHAFIFAAVIVGLVALNITSGDPWWVHWVAIGWGLGIALHATLVWGRLGERITAWQLRKVYRLKSQM